MSFRCGLRPLTARCLSTAYRAASKLPAGSSRPTTADAAAGELQQPLAGTCTRDRPTRFYLDLQWADTVSSKRIVVALPNDDSNPYRAHAAALFNPTDGYFAVGEEASRLSLCGAVMFPSSKDTGRAADEKDPPPDELQATFLDGERIDLDQLRHLQEYDADTTQNQHGDADREIGSGRVGLIVLPTDLAELAAGRLAIELATDGPCATRASGGRVVGAVIDGIEFLTDIKGPALQITSCGPITNESRPGEQSEGMSAGPSAARGKIYGYTMYE